MSEYIAKVIQGEYNLAFDGYECYSQVDYTQPIVRCRDCKHWATGERLTGGCTGKNGDADQYGYCAWGERRDAE